MKMPRFASMLALSFILLIPSTMAAEPVTMQITDLSAPAKAFPGQSFTVSISIQWSGFNNLRYGQGPGGNTFSPPPTPPYGLRVTICEGVETSCSSPLWQQTDKSTDNSGSKTYAIQLAAPQILGSWQLTASFALSLTWMTNTINLIRDHRTFDVNISDRVALTVQVEPPTANVAVTVDGSPIATDGTGKTQAQLKFGQVYSVQVPSEVLVAAGTRLFFVKWSDGQTSNSRTHSANDDAALTAEYKTQHLLSVLPQLGNPQGSGWYDVGTTATISVTSPWPVEGFLGVLGGKYMFDHWSGGATGTAPSVSLTMDGPKTVTAEWREDNTIPYAIIGAVLGIALVAAAIVVKRRKSPRLN